MENNKLIADLNRMLENEHACIIRYYTHAAVVTGPYADEVATRLREIATDEELHAEKLRARITGLGGAPSMQVSQKDLRPAIKLDQILEINMDEEKMAIKSYLEIFDKTPETNVILYQTLQEIIRDEQEHLEELENLVEERK